MHSINTVHIEDMYVCTFIYIFIFRTVELILFKFSTGRSKLNKRCVNIFSFCSSPKKPRWHIRYSDWLRAGWHRGQSLSPNRVKNSLLSRSSRPALEPTQAPIQWVLGALSPVVKQPGHEADHSRPTSADIKKMWIYTSTPPYAFMAQWFS
jgi:hypothetical protein